MRRSLLYLRKALGSEQAGIAQSLSATGKPSGNQLFHLASKPVQSLDVPQACPAAGQGCRPTLGACQQSFSTAQDGDGHDRQSDGNPAERDVSKTRGKQKPVPGPLPAVMEMNTAQTRENDALGKSRDSRLRDSSKDPREEPQQESRRRAGSSQARAAHPVADPAGSTGGPGRRAQAGRGGRATSASPNTTKQKMGKSQSSSSLGRQQGRKGATANQANVKPDNGAGRGGQDECHVQEWESIVSDKWITEELEAVDVGSYLGIPRNLLPEIFFEKEMPIWEELHPRGGCRGLEEELAATDMDLVMYREATHVLATEVAGKTSKKLYLVGPPSSGKSIAMATMVALMRSKNWLVMYIPDARQLTSGGFFHRNVHGTWDTPEVAKLILHYLVAGNPSRVDEVQSQKSGRSLRELAQLAIDNTDSHETVDIFLEAKEAISAAPNALIAIDNYQALYAPTDYGQWLSPTKRRVLEADDLRVAAALKALDQDALPDGVVLCAANRSSSFSPRMRFPMYHGATILTIPRMSLEEWSAMSDYYRLTGATPPLSSYAIKKAYYSMVANPTEYRKFAPLISADDEETAETVEGSEAQPVAGFL